MKRVVHTDAPPTAKQIYLISRLVLTQMGEDWPENRGAAHDLIQALQDPDYVLAMARLAAGGRP